MMSGSQAVSWTRGKNNGSTTPLPDDVAYKTVKRLRTAPSVKACAWVQLPGEIVGVLLLYLEHESLFTLLRIAKHGFLGHATAGVVRWPPSLVLRCLPNIHGLELLKAHKSNLCRAIVDGSNPWGGTVWDCARYLPLTRRLTLQNWRDQRLWRTSEGISKLSQLEELVFLSCDQLVELSRLSELHGLRVVRFRNCHRLPSLHFLARLPALQTLDFTNSSSESVLDILRFANLRGKLEHFCAPSNYSWGVSLLRVLGGLRSLRTLELPCSARLSAQGLLRLARIPTLANLVLHNVSCPSVTALAPLTGLRSLELRQAYFLQDLKGLPSGLEELVVTDCVSLESLRGINVPGLRRLCLSGSQQALGLDSLFTLCKLEYLELSGRGCSLRGLRGLAALPSFRVLNLCDGSPASHKESNDLAWLHVQRPGLKILV